MHSRGFSCCSDRSRAHRSRCVARWAEARPPALPRPNPQTRPSRRCAVPCTPQSFQIQECGSALPSGRWGPRLWDSDRACAQAPFPTHLVVGRPLIAPVLRRLGRCALLEPAHSTRTRHQSRLKGSSPRRAAPGALPCAGGETALLLLYPAAYPTHAARAPAAPRVRKRSYRSQGIGGVPPSLRSRQTPLRQSQPWARSSCDSRCRRLNPPTKLIGPPQSSGDPPP